MGNVFKNIVIIKHPSGQNFFSYDFLCKDSFCGLIDNDQGYKLNCGFVKKFQEKNPRFIYLFSEDDGHIPQFNWIVNYVEELVIKGAKLIEMNAEAVDSVQEKEE